MRWLAIAGCAAILLGIVGGVAGHTKAVRRQQAANKWLQQAGELESEDRWPEAAQALEAYLNLEPAASEQRVRLAKLYARGVETPEQREHAIELLYRAVGICPDDDRLPLQIQLGELLLAAERFSEAEAQATRVIQARPQESSALRVRALALLRQYKRGELDRTLSRNLPVVTWLDEARRANRNDVELAELTAAAYRNLELGAPGHPSVVTRERLADTCLDELVQAIPQNPGAHLARYRYRLRLGQADADSDLESALACGPDHQPTLLTAAKAAMHEAQFAKAVEFYRRAMEVSQIGTDADTHLELGDALLASSERAQALDVWRAGLKEHPEAQIQFHGKLADAYLASRDWKKAGEEVIAIDEALWRQAAPDDDMLSVERDQCLRRGVLFVQRGNSLSAIEQFQRTITLQEQLGGCSPQTALAWRHLGELYSRSSQWTSAASAFDYACHEQPLSADLWLLAAQAHLKAKHIDLAVERAHQAIQQGVSTPAQAILASARLAQSFHPRSSSSEIWPTLAAMHDILPNQALSGSTTSLMDGQLGFDAAIVLAQVQGQRGEHALAQELLLRAVPAGSDAERTCIDRELVSHAISRGDISEALGLLSRFLLDSPDNVALRKLTAEIGLDNARRQQEQEAAAFLP